jgi:YaiO family outer membrane protein
MSEPSKRRWLWPHVLCHVASGCLALIAFASQAAEGIGGELEAGAIYYNVNEGFGDTHGAYVRGRLDTGTANQWRAEAVELKRFGDDGFYGALGNVHQFDADWFSSVTIGSSAGGFYWPRIRTDTSLSRRWLAGRNLVTTVGITYFDAKDIHSDTGFNAEAVYYTASPWIVQAGTTYNISHPGAAASTSAYVALSHAVNGARIVTARLGGGEQAYQPFADDRFKVGITFGTLRVSCKQWIGKHWGVNVAADSYLSSTYDQHGMEVGLFQEF